MADYTKRVSEVIFIDAYFSARLQDGEDLDTVLCQAFEYDSDSVIEDYDITDVDEVIVQLKSGTVISYSRSYPTTGMIAARLVLSTGSVVASGVLDPDTVDVGGYVLEIDEASATVRVKAGSEGNTYTIRFTATTNYGNTLVEEKTIDVVP